jgi:hypothetical protein
MVLAVKPRVHSDALLDCRYATLIPGGKRAFKYGKACTAVVQMPTSSSHILYLITLFLLIAMLDSAQTPMRSLEAAVRT